MFVDKAMKNNLHNKEQSKMIWFVSALLQKNCNNKQVSVDSEKSGNYTEIRNLK